MLALCAMIATPAFPADEPSPPASERISPARMKLAEEMVEQMEMRKVFDSSVESYVDIMRDAWKKQIPNLGDADRKLLEGIARTELAKNTDTLLKQTIVIYARHFSEADLKAAIAFNKTPAGRRMIAVMPAITDECAKLGAALIAPTMDRIAAEFQSQKSSKAKTNAL